jgi:hypothetical protein
LHKFTVYSLVCLVLGSLAWILSFISPSLSPSLDRGFPVWAITVIISPIGIIFSAKSLNMKLKYSILLLLGNVIIFPTSMFFLLTVMEAIGLFK